MKRETKQILFSLCVTFLVIIILVITTILVLQGIPLQLEKAFTIYCSEQNGTITYLENVDCSSGHQGCGCLFKSGSGIIICGEKRVDGNQFLCKWCLKEKSLENRWWRR